jgi:hypothetical protein
MQNGSRIAKGRYGRSSRRLFNTSTNRRASKRARYKRETGGRYKKNSVVVNEQTKVVMGGPC